MLETLSARLQAVFRAVRGEARLTEAAVDAALRDLRLALLEADVHVRVVKAFIERVRAKALDAEVRRSLTPAQHVVRIVRDELVALFGDAPRGLPPSRAVPRIIVLLGLQGSGKTTTAAKLGVWLARRGRYPLLVSTDVRRPAAIEQLAVLGRQAELRVSEGGGATEPVRRALEAITEARHLGFDTVIVDTAGRLHVDETLMGELEQLVAAIDPSDRLYIADAMTGQDAVRSAGEFHRRVGVTGVVLTKLDGDARGGAALSVVSVVGVPIVFAATGERLADLEAFEPTRFVSRLLGMGDLAGLVEKAEQAGSADAAAALARAVEEDGFTLEAFREQLRLLRRMGPLDQVMRLLPGCGGGTPMPAGFDERELVRIEAIIDSMTPRERRHPQIIDGSRRRRIARGSGTTVEEVNRLLRQFAEVRKLVKRAKGLAGRRGGGGRVLGRAWEGWPRA